MLTAALFQTPALPPSAPAVSASAVGTPAAVISPTPAAATALSSIPTTTLIVHYYRPDADYAGWNLWIWVPGQEGSSFSFQSTDSFGSKAVITRAGRHPRLGFILRKGNWEAKDTPDDRFVEIPVSGKAEIWLVQADPRVYLAPPPITARLQATLDSSHRITVRLAPPLLRSALAGAAGAGFRLWEKESPTEATGQQKVSAGQPAKQEWRPVPIAAVEEPFTQPYRWLDDGRKAQFLFVPTQYGVPVEAAVLAQQQLYVSGSMNNWSDTATGSFRPDPAWQMSWDESTGCYQLTKDVGNGPGQVSAGMEFKFAAWNGQYVTWYPGGIADNLVLLPPIQPTTQGVTTQELVRTVELVTGEPLSPRKNYLVSREGYAETPVRVGSILDTPEFTYEGNDLGVTYSPRATEFRLWAPTAQSVRVLLYSSPTACEPRIIPMSLQSHGVWFAHVPGDLNGHYYEYEIHHGQQAVTVPDPYSRGAAANSSRTLIFDPATTNPPGWQEDHGPVLTSPVDAIIYEAHVRDLTIDSSSGVEPAALRGKFLGLAQQGTRGPQGVTTGLDHIKELGVTHVHLLPVFDSGTINELDPNSRNWGYDPVLYNTPEGSYATDPEGIARIREFKELVAAFHRNGIGVIMDVVYNHTLATGLYNRLSIFDKVVPGYYYRRDSSDAYANGTSCGNEVASERPMVRKFIVDSVRYWTQEYHIDGMRFDLMALIDRETMARAVAAARAINPSFLAYGEPWAAGPSPLPPAWQMTKGNQRGMGIAVFNDDFREAMKGPWTDDRHGGFINGVGGYDLGILLGLGGATDDFAASPAETVQYVTCHDGMTLWDRVSTSNSYDPYEDRVKMVLLAHAMVLTAQGIPFFQEGEEFLRTKGFVANSYNADDRVNALDWSLKAAHRDVYEYFRGLIALRKAHPSFRLRTAEDVRRSLTLLQQKPNLVAFELRYDQDSWKQIVVIYNGSRFPRLVHLPAGEWVAVVAGKQAGVTPVTDLPSHYAGQVTVPAFSAMVLYNPDA